MPIAVSHGEDTLTWDQLERNANRRARAFAAKGVKPGDFVAIGLPNGNAFFETTFAVWKCGATPTSLSWRLPRGEAAAVLDILKPSLVVGGEARLERAQFAAGRFRARRLFRRTAGQPDSALLEGHDQWRLDRTTQGNPRSSAGRDRYRGRAALGIPLGASLLNPGPLYHNAPFIVSHFGAVRRRKRDRPGQIRRRGTPAPDRSQSGCNGSISYRP